MKKSITKTFTLTTFLAVLFLSLFSFTTKFGGDMIAIYLNKQLVMKQFVHNDKSVKTVTLSTADANKELDVYYHHCGSVGKDRTLIIKDQDNRVLKNWRFANAAMNHDAMTVSVKEVIGLYKPKAVKKLNLYYTSKELPSGKLLASIIYQDQAVASLSE